MKTISLKIPPTLDAQLKALAREKGVTKSSVVREIVGQYLAGGSRGPSGSILATALDLIGCVDGPSDLSSHPRHLKRYGR